MWEFGSENMHVKKTYSELVLGDLIKDTADIHLHLNWPVKKVESLSKYFD